MGELELGGISQLVPQQFLHHRQVAFGEICLFETGLRVFHRGRLQDGNDFGPELFHQRLEGLNHGVGPGLLRLNGLGGFGAGGRRGAGRLGAGERGGGQSQGATGKKAPAARQLLGRTRGNVGLSHGRKEIGWRRTDRHLKRQTPEPGGTLHTGGAQKRSEQRAFSDVASRRRTG